MTEAMWLDGVDPFFGDKESSAPWTKPEEGSTDDFLDQYVKFEEGDGDSSEPGGRVKSSYYADHGFATEESMISPPTSTDVSQLPSMTSSADGIDHFQPSGIASLRSGSLRATQHTLEEQSWIAAHTSSAQRELGGRRGPISDSELQKLEGLSMGSPRQSFASTPRVSAPFSPRKQSATAAKSPKKPGAMETLYATIRKATKFRARTQLQGTSVAMSTAPIGSHGPGHGGFIRPQDSELPPTPPLSGHMVSGNPSQRDLLGVTFVNGHVEDPFGASCFDEAHGPVHELPSQHVSHHGLMTPGHPLSAAHPAPGWPLPDGYASSNSTSANEIAWTGNQHRLNHTQPSTPSGPWSATTPGHTHTLAHRASISSLQSANARNATTNLTLQLQQGGDIYQTNNNNHHHQRSASAIPLHMPQPRHSAAPILHQNHPNSYGHSRGHAHSLSLGSESQSYLAPPTHSRPPPATPGRRHKPRAPSSGARHTSTSVASPRQAEPRKRSASSSSTTTSSFSPAKPAAGHRTARRATSSQDLTSTTTTTTSSSSSSSRTGPTTAGPVLNSSVRKRRGRSRSVPAAPRTPSHGSSATSSAESPGGRAGWTNGQIGFVNYTPDDSMALMTGVAPSGSSKTKARREREAAERQRRLSEAVMKAVAAAGGDVGRLRREIVLDGEGGTVY